MHRPSLGQLVASVSRARPRRSRRHTIGTLSGQSSRRLGGTIASGRRSGLPVPAPVAPGAAPPRLRRSALRKQHFTSVGAATGIFQGIEGSNRNEEPRERPELRPWGRRTFLAVTLGGLSSLLWGGAAWRAVSGALGGAAAEIPQSLRGLVPTGGWRIYTVAATMPGFDPQTWRLRIDGLVRKPQTLSYEQLLALPRRRETADFHCVTGWSVDHVHWAGVGFHDLLAAAQPLREADAVVFWSAEHPYVDSLTLAQTLDDGMLATHMDGKPLSRPHGAPTRVVIPKMYGYKNVKWVERIELVRRQPLGYWEQRGYDQDAWVGRSNGYHGSSF